MNLKQVVVYQPANRYWSFQWIETGIYLTVAILLAWGCFWWVRRRACPERAFRAPLAAPIPGAGFAWAAPALPEDARSAPGVARSAGPPFPGPGSRVFYNASTLAGWLPIAVPTAGCRHGPLRVPEITVAFWVIKAMSTALGEATSDFLVHQIAPALAVVLGFIAFVVALVLQFRRGHYNAWNYWFAVVMVGTFGTMAADVLHVGLGVPYAVSTVIYAVVLMAVFVVWRRSRARCRSTASTRPVGRPSTGRPWWPRSRWARRSET